MDGIDYRKLMEEAEERVAGYVRDALKNNPALNASIRSIPGLLETAAEVAARKAADASTV